jgi:hypothetical protein
LRVNVYDESLCGFANVITERGQRPKKKTDRSEDFTDPTNRQDSVMT